MAKIRVRATLDAPPAQVWVALSDLASHVAWMHDAVAIRFVTDRTYGVGARFECDTKVGPLRLTDVMEVTEWSPGRALGVRHVGVVTGTGRFVIQRARGGRTRVSWVEELRFPAWLGGPVGARAAAPVLRRIWRRNLAALGEHVAAGA
jgi:carbon monoxide dehydrogenase subunit G